LLIYHSYTKLANDLILNGADAAPLDHDNITPLREACKNGHVDTVELLLDRTHNQKKTWVCWSVSSTDAPFPKSKWTMVSLFFSQAMNSGVLPFLSAKLILAFLSSSNIKTVFGS
jgi:ankyrin repeat protein